MSSISDEYAVSSLKYWFHENHDIFTIYSATSEFKDSGHGSACVVLETERYLIDICAWDHASCLDIQILEIDSEESTFQHIGDCETRQVFHECLQKFMGWLKNEFQSNT
jgi:hypothetical protein